MTTSDDKQEKLNEIGWEEELCTIPRIGLLWLLS